MTTATLPTTLSELLQNRAATLGDQTAYVFLSGPPEQEQADSMTFAELDARARRVAALLQRNAVDLGDRVLLLCRPGLDYVSAFMGCLYAGAVAVPAYPPRNKQHMVRIAGIVRNAGANTILCSPDDLERCTTWIADTEASGSTLLDVGAAEAVPPLHAPAGVPPSHVAFLQYTSGTTGTPKGVMVSHGNLMHNLGMLREWFAYDERSTMVSWLPPYHDMGLIGVILTSLYGGFRSVLMAPERFIQHPYLWLRAISEYRADLTGAPDFAYRMACRRISDEQLATLDLSCIRTAYNGAESVRAGTLSDFAKRFAAAGFSAGSFRPCYGLAEGTLFVAGRTAQQPIRTVCADQAALQRQSVVIRGEFAGVSPAPLDRPGERVLVSVGRPAGDQRVVVRDLETNGRCVDGTIGEICVAGPSVAAGYWQLDEQTQSTFRHTLAGNPDQAFMRTGDLGFMLGGELYVTGRLKDMVILAGRNYYSEDIEYALIVGVPELVPNGCAAFMDDQVDAERLIVVAEVERTQRKGNLDGFIDAIRQAIWSRLDIGPSAIVLVSPGSVPKTSSGKVRRSTCRTQLRDGELTILAQWDVETGAHTPTPERRPPDRRPPDRRQPARPAAAIDAPPADGRRQHAASTVDELNDWLRHYARTRIDSRTIDERRTIPPHVVLDFGNQGLLGMPIDRSYGGLGFTHRDTLRVISQLAAIDSTLAFFVGLNNTLGILPIMQHAQAPLRDELLPSLASGRMLAAFAMSEPAAGSHPRAITSRAQRIDSGDWLVSGNKSWCGSSAWAGIVNVFARQADGAGMVGLAVRPGTPGVRIGAEELTMGVRGMIQNSLHLDRARISDAYRLGGIGQGMSVAQQAMNIARLAIAAVCLGGMKRCAQLMHRYGARRRIGTGLLLDNPLSRLRLGELRHRIDGLGVLVEHLAAELDLGVAVPEDCLLISKILGSELLSQSADEMMQFLGGRGYVETNLAPQIFRDARLTRIFEGPTETLLVHLGSRLLNGSDDLLRYLETALGAGVLARELRQLGEQLAQDGLANASKLDGAAHAAVWVNYWLGTVAQWGVLLAVIERAAAQQRIDDGALRWAQSQYELAIEAAQRQVGLRSALSTTAELNAWAERNGVEIGSIEQTIPGASQSVDSLLVAEAGAHSVSREPDEPAGEDAGSVAGLIAPEPASRIDRERVASVEQWLIAWLGERLKHRKLRLTRESTFAEIGFDSILAVEMTMVFSETFSVTVDPSAVWDYPSIRALSAHLAPRIHGAAPAAAVAHADSDAPSPIAAQPSTL
ncbi:AMP-binding protein [Burkholderia ubonensis]|uniref:AMP-binding protein n=1 Tax=Burkholderia ubonensis TaxID=101571 RepID=UPI0007559953|nr:AMP-binding protein [Burkholderia ubonensis]KVQ77607.1 AMP-dependent synthetase [Burkholderia ubonensis]KVR15581.1 AMP-dependent synthetase [Burkholderia ubonensis]KWD34348.1 AMP-dependent synthetase [Burkholderia ubonensis]KWD46456.1 AMP-dependent synthetase [Burkholderia ubonensis]KWQ03158.1 AMP-dependent synthetase [Burkholderia ubonensis]